VIANTAARRAITRRIAAGEIFSRMFQQGSDARAFHDGNEAVVQQNNGISSLLRLFAGVKIIAPEQSDRSPSGPLHLRSPPAAASAKSTPRNSGITVPASLRILKSQI
jgi:hypothetical protein